METDPRIRTIRSFAEAEDMHAKIAESAANTAKWLVEQGYEHLLRGSTPH